MGGPLAGGGLRVEDGLAGGDIEDRLHEIVCADLLEEVTVAAAPDGVVDQLVVDDGGEEENARLRIVLEDTAAGVEAGAVGQADVEEDDVGADGGGHVDGLGDLAGFANEGDAAFGGEEGFESHADDLAVVDDGEAECGGGGGHESMEGSGALSVSTRRVPRPGSLWQRSCAARRSARACILSSP